MYLQKRIYILAKETLWRDIFILGIFYMPELGVSGINIGNWHHSRHQPLVGASAVEIRACQLNWSRIFFRARRAMECIGFICIIGIAYFYLIRNLCVMSTSNVVRQPGAIPFIDFIQIVCVILWYAVRMMGAQVLDIERVPRGYFCKCIGSLKSSCRKVRGPKRGNVLLKKPRYDDEYELLGEKYIAEAFMLGLAETSATVDRK